MKKTIVKNLNWGKSRCCRAGVECSGGGYSGEDIIPVTVRCIKCDKTNPLIIQRIGRPVKMKF